MQVCVHRFASPLTDVAHPPDYVRRRYAVGRRRMQGGGADSNISGAACAGPANGMTHEHVLAPLDVRPLVACSHFAIPRPDMVRFLTRVSRPRACTDAAKCRLASPLTMFICISRPRRLSGRDSALTNLCVARGRGSSKLLLRWVDAHYRRAGLVSTKRQPWCPCQATASVRSSVWHR